MSDKTLTDFPAGPVWRSTLATSADEVNAKIETLFYYMKLQSRVLPYWVEFLEFDNKYRFAVHYLAADDVFGV